MSPLNSETSDSFCPVTAFTTLDFPAFLSPKNPIWIRSDDGLSLSPAMINTPFSDGPAVVLSADAPRIYLHLM